jgi:hypothetical protein
MTNASPSNGAGGAGGSPAPSASGRGRRWTVRALLVLGTLLAVVSIFAVWANRQLLNADNWTDTSSALLAEPAVQSQLAGYVVDQVYANVDVSGELRSALPPRPKPLAGPAANGLRDLAERTTTKALGRPRIQEAWRTANHATATQLIATIKGDAKVTRISGNAVILDLRPIVIEIAARLGLPNSLVAKVPASAGKVRVMSSDQLSTFQNGARGLGSLATILPILALSCLGLAVLLARDRRRLTLLWAGTDLAIAGGAALVARSLIGDHVVSALATTDAVKPAAEAVWSIGTRMLVDVAQATIVGAIPLVLAALLAGPSRPAVALRRAAAPWLRDRPAAVYATEAILVLLVVASGPIPATRKVLPVLVMIGLLVLGVEVLRRQVAREFPDATAGATRAAISASARSAREALTTRGRPAPRPAAGQDRFARLERLADLHARGALTDGVFDSEKAALLSH